MKQIIITILAVFITTSTFAQAPQAFSYQGVARDLSGNPVANQNIELQIAVLQGSATGMEIYKETHSTFTNDLGLFSLQIGNGTIVSGSFEIIDWGSDIHFLQIEMDDTGDNNYQLIGASELLSVPYSLYAENGSKWRDNSNGIDYKDGYVGVGTMNPQSRLHLVEENDDAILIIESDVNDNNEEDNPRIEFLHDGGYPNSAIGLNLLENGIENGMYIANTTSARGGIHLATDNSANTWTSSMIRMTVATDGNIGIGVVEPKSRLQVADGDIYIEDINNGVIMKSPNGQCWRMTVTNSGQPEFNAITCPN